VPTCGNALPPHRKRTLQRTEKAIARGEGAQKGRRIEKFIVSQSMRLFTTPVPLSGKNWRTSKNAKRKKEQEGRGPRKR